MIKTIIINKLSDGVVLCQSSQGYADQELLQVKLKVKTHHKEVTSYTKAEQTPLKLIEHHTLGIYYKVNNRVVFTAIVDKSYPMKLANGLIDTIAATFFDQAKIVLGTTNFHSRLEAITSDHYFVKFDRTIKSKKKDFQDPGSMKNVERMKKQLQSIHDIMRQNMGRLEQRQQSLQATEDKARRISEQSKKFDQSTKKLVWYYWLRNNLIWVVLAITVIIILFLIF